MPHSRRIQVLLFEPCQKATKISTKPLNQDGIYAQEYADDTVIVARDKLSTTLTELSQQRAPRKVENWCLEENLRVNQNCLVYSQTRCYTGALLSTSRARTRMGTRRQVL